LVALINCENLTDPTIALIKPDNCQIRSRLLHLSCDSTRFRAPISTT
jgi:hypothetical protein